MFQYVYSTLFPKYFCRVDGYDIRNKLAFEVAHAGYQKENSKRKSKRIKKKIKKKICGFCIDNNNSNNNKLLALSRKNG